MTTLSTKGEVEGLHKLEWLERQRVVWVGEVGDEKLLAFQGRMVLFADGFQLLQLGLYEESVIV